MRPSPLGLQEAGTAMQYRAVISNRPDAAGLAWAKSRGLETRVVDHKAFAQREAFDAALALAINAFTPDFVLYAGFMRIVGFAPKDGWTQAFMRFRTVRDAIQPR